jgi:DNA-binding transcriptional ArsR family regulator/uncharacterized protein YndB with AHSA1/START domain
MLTPEASAAHTTNVGSGVWRALGNPARRQILDSLRNGPRTTGQLAAELPGLSRFAVMQHLGVLVEADLVLVRRQGRERFNYLNPVPLRRWYERWIVPLADVAAAEMLALQRSIEREGGQGPVAVAVDEFRTVRIQTELRLRAPAQRVFEALTTRTGWFPATYGEDRVREIVLEPRVGGAYYEDWGDGRGHLYGHITEYDPPLGLAYRGRLHPGSILDTEYALEEAGKETILKVSKVAVGPMTEEEARGIHKYGDIKNFEDALRAAVERDGD